MQLLQHTITKVSSLCPSELQTTLYSGPGQGMKTHFWLGSGISMKLMVTCGKNVVSINGYP